MNTPEKVQVTPPATETVSRREFRKGFNADSLRAWDLKGDWSWGAGPATHQVSFTVADGRLVMTHPAGAYSGGVASDSPDVLVLHHAERGAGPPFDVWVNLRRGADGTLVGHTITLGGDEDDPIAVYVKRMGAP